MKYTVLEMQKNHDGTSGTIVNNYDDKNQAEAKWHDILRHAALSNVAVHSAVILNEEGFLTNTKCYKHEPVEQQTGQTQGQAQGQEQNQGQAQEQE